MTATLRDGDHVHLVGVGGAGMSPLATILLERGHPVSGSDLKPSPILDALGERGATVHVGHRADHVGDADLVVISSAVPPTNPELMAARERGIPVLVRAELLQLIMAGRRRVLISGTHGKTTTTAMATSILDAAGLDPGFAVGGVLAGSDVSARAGAGEVFVAEADEAYRSFLHLTPDCGVVTNLEMDHHDEYADEAAVVEAFLGFAARRTPGGPFIVCLDDPGAADLAGRLDDPVWTYGTAADARWRIEGVSYGPEGARFRVVREGEDLGIFTLPFTGVHNVRNATAAIAAAMWAGAGVDDARRALGAFAGTKRRFQRIGEARGVLVVDDYAHHPTELQAVIAAAREARPGGRILVAFQPHRWSRTAAFGPGMGEALAAADLAMVTDVYAAGEEPVEGAGPTAIVAAGREAGGRLEHVSDPDRLPGRLAAEAEPGDTVLVLGAGDITRQAPAVLGALDDDGGVDAGG